MAFGGKLNNDDELLSEINVTPLVDVMLVLLVIFILTVPVLTHTVSLELPKATAKPQTTQQKNIVTISVQRDGTVLWNDEPLTQADLHDRLIQTAKEANQPEIQIRGDQYAEYGHVVKIMAAAQNAGIQKLGLITKPD